MSFKFTKCDIPDVIHVEPQLFGDDRGFFAELYKSSSFKENGIAESFVQVNTSKSQKHVVRGLHYQKNPKAQGKLVSVARGKIFDVAVDIRKGSPYYGRWVSATLSAGKKNMLYIPRGFAHGFSVLSATAEVIYYCTGEFAPDCEGGIIYNDPLLNIKWDISEPILSSKDSQYPPLHEADNNFIYEKDKVSQS